MNLRRFVISLLLVIFLNTGLFYVLQAAPAEQDTPPATATLVPASGSIELLRFGSTAWEAVTTPQMVGNGDRIRAAAGSRAVVFWTDDMRLELYENSEIHINHFSMNPDGTFWVESSQVVGMSVHRVGRSFDDRSRYLIDLPGYMLSNSSGIFGVLVEPNFSSVVIVGEGASLAQHPASQQVIQADMGFFVPRYSASLPAPTAWTGLPASLIAALENPLNVTPQSTLEPGALVGTPEPGMSSPDGTPEPGFTPEPGHDDDDDDNDDDFDDDDDDNDDDNSGSGSDSDDDDDDDD